MGAIAEGGVRVLNASVIQQLSIPDSSVERAEARETLELERHARTFRGGRPAPDVAGRVVILIDDGLATGATMEAAVAALRANGPSSIVVAVPVAAAETAERLRRSADDLIAVATPEPFHAVGAWYEDFSQTTDAEVIALLAAQAR